MQRLDWRSSNKHATLQNLSVYYTKTTKLKIIAPTWNDEFELLEGSYSTLDIQTYVERIIKKHKTLLSNPSIHIYINWVNNTLEFKMKNWYKLGLQTRETMILFASTKKLIDKTKNGENVPSLEVVEVVLVLQFSRWSISKKVVGVI